MSYKINLMTYFDELIASRNDGVAVVDGKRTLTFKELYDKSKQLAKQLQHICQSNTNKVIAVHIPKSIESVIADLAIIFSGNAYLNLDPKNPEARLKGIVDHCKVDLILSLSKNKTDFFDNSKVIFPFDEEFSSDESSEELQYKNIIDTDPLCVINTSGSTGIPKAVMLHHRGMSDFIEAVKKEGILTGPEVIGSLSPAFFDIYAFELCMLMVWGSKIVIIPESLAVFPLKMLELLNQENVSYIFWVPTIMVNIANSDLLSVVNLQSLKRVWFAGEVFPTSKFKYWADKLPNAEFVNMYGPIEIHVDCLFYKVPHDVTPDKPLPIGKPFFNTSILVLDENDRQVSAGDEGELCIRGTSLAHGYYNDPEKTQKAFSQNPLNTGYPERIYRTGDLVKLGPDGNYIFMGRKDTLVKRMGYRIELSEIEHIAVDVVDLIKNCCVIYNPDTKDLVMFYESDDEIPSAQMKIEILKFLPRYMVPTVFNHLSQIPKNPNGKIDRKYLKELVLKNE